ncbi:MAG TPA: SIMPL domain-containing protein [Aggregatilineaceae bacterium]|nr:SIMPL domain-containing protein [Aggregatilineaceae bacterium]
MITVTGTGSAHGKPDLALVNLGVESRHADLSQAMNDANTTIQRVQNVLHGAGIAAVDVQTSQFNINRFEDPAPNSLFVVTHMLHITVRHTAELGAVIQAAVDAGANQMHGLDFGVSDPGTLEQEARQLALEDARTRAQALADGLGLTLGNPVSVTEGHGGGLPVPMPKMALRSSGPAISEGQLSVVVQVTVVYEMH